MKRNKIYLGNNLEILKTFPDNSIDSVVTDPPYGLGKEPDAMEVLKGWITDGYYEVEGKGFMGKEWDAFVPQPNFWKEVYRVLKPGGYLLSFAGTRTYDWMVMSVRLAGFEIRDMIGWLYGSGFPKGQDVSKAIDNHFGLEREVVGKLKGSGSTGINSVGNQQFVSKNQYEDGTFDETKPNHELAKKYDGWNTNLKPAIEPVVMARKPFDTTVAENIIEYGVGGINIDECRIPTNELTPRNNKDGQNGVFNASGGYVEPSKLGRYPANIIHDGSDEVEAVFPQTTSGKMLSTHNRTTDGSPVGIYGKFDKDHPLSETYGDSGSASRFFYVAKASQWERNYGLKSFEAKETRGGGGRASDGYDRDNPEEERLRKAATAFGAVQAVKQNIHPTVKPIDLMRYLIKLVTPKGGLVLDPFVGSGTTAIAAKLEHMEYIGIELMPEYYEIAKARIKAHNVITYDIFDFMGGD